MEMPTIRQTILETLNQRGPLCIDEIAASTHLSKMAARYHLGLLVREQLVARREVAHRGGVGRPQIVYGLADDAYAHLPQQYELLAEHLMGEIVTALGPKETRTLLRRVGRRVAESAPALRVGSGLGARVQRAGKFLSAHGYMACTGKVDDGLSLAVCNCPFRQVALEHREICEMDLALVGALLDGPIKMTHCIANRDAQCRFVAKKQANERLVRT
jgi:DeoR family transcriptional regulator, suf operon transcriptional repressor